MLKKSTRILGIDPGFGRLGLAVIEKGQTSEILLYSNCFLTESKLDFGDRLRLLGGQLAQIIKKYKPDTLALEKLFLTNNQKTAMRVSEVRGMIIYLAKLNKLELIELTPQEIKNSVAGHGRADKAQVAAMVRRLIRLPHEPRHDDEFDAIATALAAATWLIHK